jgi:Domain of unknown function (DUF4956)
MSDLFLVQEVSFVDLSRNFGLAILFALIWYAVFAYTARMVPNKTQYLRVFLLLAPTMVLIITIIKGSLALSLGLVGALSIVRFRTPIKEPAELLYLFVMIAVGLGLGAGRVAETSIAFALLCAIMLALSLVRPKADYRHDYFIEVQFDGDQSTEPPTAGGLLASLGELQTLARIKKFAQEEHSTHAVLGVSSQRFEQLDAIMARLRQHHPVAHIALVENVNLII